MYQRCKFGSFLSLSALLCWLHHTEITIPRITIYLCVICRRCKTEQQRIVYVYANVRVNVLERRFKITVTAVRKKIISLSYIQRELQLWEVEAEDNVYFFKVWFYGPSVFCMSWDRDLAFHLFLASFSPCFCFLSSYAQHFPFRLCCFFHRSSCPCLFFYGNGAERSKDVKEGASRVTSREGPAFVVSTSHIYPSLNWHATVDNSDLY